MLLYYYRILRVVLVGVRYRSKLSRVVRRCVRRASNWLSVGDVEKSLRTTSGEGFAYTIRRAPWTKIGTLPSSIYIERRINERVLVSLQIADDNLILGYSRLRCCRLCEAYSRSLSYSRGTTNLPSQTCERPIFHNPTQPIYQQTLVTQHRQYFQ